MSSDRHPFHSALGGPKGLAGGPITPVQSFTGKAGVAFVWDAAKGIPDAMLEADLFYGEPPWRAGYETFAARAGQDNLLPWPKFMAELNERVRALDMPRVMTHGKEAADLVHADATVPCFINGGNALVSTWGIKLSPGLDTAAILAILAQRFKCVADPFCGYGRSGRIFAQRGRRYIMSDFNAECIGYIAAHEAEWLS